MRISDWSSDVCSSDLRRLRNRLRQRRRSWPNGAVPHRWDGPPQVPAACCARQPRGCQPAPQNGTQQQEARRKARSEEHTSELQSLMRISYAVFCLKKKTKIETAKDTITHKPKTK